MLIGIALNIPAVPHQTDAEVVREHLTLGRIAESLGFDSIWALEHHFSDFLLSPAPFELLAFFAGQTTTSILGTAAIVLPWHDPVRVAEQIAMLEIIANSRCVFAFGRGRAPTEFQGFRIPMEESRARFIEAAEIIVSALTNGSIRYSGRHYTIPDISVRPRISTRVHERFFGAAMSRESIALMARLRFGILTSTQKPWRELSDDVLFYRSEARRSDFNPYGPIVLAAVSVARKRDDAWDRAMSYFSNEWTMTDSHYGYSDGNVARVRGYEGYAGAESYFRTLKNPDARQLATKQYAELQIVGTPSDCIRQIELLSELTEPSHLVLEFSFGGMPLAQAEDNMRLFSSDVLPFLHRSSAGRFPLSPPSHE